MTHIRFGLGAALLVLGIAGSTYTVATAQDNSTVERQGPGRWGRGGPGFGGGLRGPMGLAGLPLRELGLSSSQQEQVRSIMQSNGVEMRALGEKVRKAHEALAAAVAADSFDESAIRARSSELAAVEVEAAVARGRLHSEIFQILTPEQQAKAKALRTKMREHRERTGPPRRPGRA